MHECLHACSYDFCAPCMHGKNTKPLPDSVSYISCTSLLLLFAFCAYRRILRHLGQEYSHVIWYAKKNWVQSFQSSASILLDFLGASTSAWHCWKALPEQEKHDMHACMIMHEYIIQSFWNHTYLCAHTLPPNSPGNPVGSVVFQPQQAPAKPHNNICKFKMSEHTGQSQHAPHHIQNLSPMHLCLTRHQSRCPPFHFWVTGLDYSKTISCMIQKYLMYKTAFTCIVFYRGTITIYIQLAQQDNMNICQTCI